MSLQFVKALEEGMIATVTIDRPAALNALNREVLREIREVFQGLSQRDSLRVVILTGAGEKAFVAGADIGAMKGMGSQEARVMADLGHEVMNLIEGFRSPVIACVNGFCLGGGMELALACDFIVASEKAKLGLPEVNLGLFPGWGGTQRLSRLIGPGRAREMIYSGRLLSAEEAVSWGVVNRVFPAERLMGEARRLALEIADKGPLAVQMAKSVMQKGLDLPLEEGLLLEKTAFPRCFETKDVQEGIGAFLEKMKPNFQGR